MWLLSTSRAKLHSFVSPETVPGPYAILSHVWEKEEQSFQDAQKLCEVWDKAGTNPRDHVSEKIRRCCVLAAEEGYEWLWIDSCCIDKSSSAELSEAINSMFRYYELAHRCYVYLYDVPSCTHDEASQPDSAFSRSRWHRRGWTLQELLAPDDCVFLSQDWERIGTKNDLATLLEKVTSIPREILTKRATLTAASVAQRMSWGSMRATTREEDEAYSLLGIFHVSMQPLYGEGRRQAFQRLQDEVLRCYPDLSIFAWGTALLDLRPEVLSQRLGPGNLLQDERYLFAPRVAAFRDSTHVQNVNSVSCQNCLLRLFCYVYALEYTLQRPLQSAAFS